MKKSELIVAVFNGVLMDTIYYGLCLLVLIFFVTGDTPVILKVFGAVLVSVILFTYIPFKYRMYKLLVGNDEENEEGC